MQYNTIQYDTIQYNTILFINEAVRTQLEHSGLSMRNSQIGVLNVLFYCCIALRSNIICTIGYQLDGFTFLVACHC